MDQVSPARFLRELLAAGGSCNSHGNRLMFKKRAMGMEDKRYALKADVTTMKPEAVRAVLRDLLGVNSFMGIENGFRISTSMIGSSARELNRSFLARLRRIDSRTTLRAEWTSEGLTENFFDYQPRGIRKE